MMKNSTKLDKVAHFLESIVQASLGIVMKKPALTGYSEIFKQKVFLSYPCTAVAVPLQEALSTGFFSVYAKICRTKQSHNDQLKNAVITTTEISQPKPYYYNCGKKKYSAI